MAVCPIRLFPDLHLSQPCKSVHNFSAALLKLIRDLKDTLYASPGVGLAAPQIGVLEQVSVVDVTRSPKMRQIPSHGFFVLVNPVLIKGEGLQTPREGCLSVPDLLANVKRYEAVTVKTQNEEGKERIIKAKGFEALALQHEIDHLSGKLFLGRVTNVKTDVFRRHHSS